LNGAWSNPANILSGTSSSLAGYSGAGGDPIFVAMDPTQLAGLGGTFGTWSAGQTLDNVMIRIFGRGAGTVSGCLSDDSGAHCISPPTDFVSLSSSGGNPAGTFPPACASDSATGCFPNNGLWGGWNFVPTNGQISASSGTVNANGSILAATSGIFNLNWKAGGKLFVTGSTPGCAGNLCTIAAVNTSSSLTIVENAGTLTNAGYKTANSGILLWIKAGSGTSTASISVNFDYAYSDVFTMPLNGTVAQCSPNPTMVSFGADGVTPITPLAGQLCLGTHQFGPTQVLYLLIPSTGETRMLTPLYFVNAADPSMDQPQDPISGNIHMIPAAFDQSDPNTIYAQVVTTGGTSIFKGVYDAATYKYKAYSHSLYSPTSGNYAPGSDSTVYWYRGSGWSDSGLSWTNMSPASKRLDLNSQIAAADPNFDPGLFHSPSITHVSKGRAFTGNAPMSNGSGESITLIHSFDISTGKLLQSTNTWSTYPNRWCAVHSVEAVEGWYGEVCNPVGGASAFAGNPGVVGLGPWQFTPSAVLKNGAFSTDTSMTPSAPLDTCPAIPAFLQSLAPANPGCITFQSQMACSLTPYPGENVKWPCEYNPQYSELSPLAPGDGILVRNGDQGAVESLLIISVTSIGNTVYQFTAVRSASPLGYKSAPSGWTGYALPPSAACGFGYCTPGVGLWFDETAPSVSWKLDPGAFAGHSDLGNAPTPGANSYCITGYCRFNIPMASQIGSFANANRFADGSFAGVAGAIALQGYPSLHQFNAPPSEQRWMLNFRHINPSYGSGADVASDVGAVSYSAVPGTNSVFKFTAINGGLQYKSVPVWAYAGYHLLKDESSPLQGNIISDATPWQFCVVLNARECRTSSAVGEVYASVPQGTVRSSQSCVSNGYDDNFPCVFTPPAQAAWGVQQDISRNDPAGTNWRKLTMGFSGPGRQFQFGSFIPDPTGTWAFMQGYWLDGVRNDLLIAKLPPWPNPLDVTTNRSTFVTQTVSLGSSANQEARVRFGYAENGPPASFFCTARQEACSTGGTPYSFESENPQWQTCSGGCSISIPAISGRVLYFAIDRRDAGGNVVAGDVQVQIVP
jgi:hypothetical protein